MQLALSRIFPLLNGWPLVKRQSLCTDLLAGLAGAVIAAIYAKLDQDKCANCTARIFFECKLGRPKTEIRTPKTCGMPA